MKKILITGGCGFIGSNLVPKLIDRGMAVRVIDNFSAGNRPDLDGLEVEIIEGDIRDRSKVREALKGVAYVIHLAAYGSVMDSIANPVENFDVNAGGTLNLLKESNDEGVSLFVFASTGGALIGDAEPPVNEYSLPKPISPYGASKLCGEGYCHAFASAYGLRTIALRFANVYGPHSAHKKGAATVFSKELIRGQAITIYGDGNASRDFLYVDDLCRGIILALDKGVEPGAVFHLASGVETRIGDLARYLIEIAGRPDHPIHYEAARRGEVNRNFASFAKAEAELDFEPKVSLAEGLRKTWAWFLQNRSELG